MSIPTTAVDPLERDAGASGPPAPLQAARFVALVVVFYLVMAGAAVLWVLARGRGLLDVAAPGARSQLGWELALGVGAGAGVVLLTRALEARWSALRQLSDRLADLVPRLSPSQSLVCAIASAVGEELFFRGAMQDHLGPWITMTLFGLLHGGSDRRLWGWTVFALAGGALFAGLLHIGGSLVAPIVAHAVVNAVNLHALGDRPRARADATSEGPLEVGPPGALASPESAAHERQDVG